MENSTGPEYGLCPCGGQYDSRLVEVRMRVRGDVVVIKDVSQGACSRCGSRVYKAGVLERIESMFSSTGH